MYKLINQGTKMLCPHCESTLSKVIDSRESAEGIRRRRICGSCRRRYSTQERASKVRVPMIIKRDHRRESFDSEKLLNSLSTACAKRPLPVGTIEEMVAEIRNELSSTADSEISSEIIGTMVMTKLKEMDRIAYIRFASVYLDFNDPDQFKSEVESLEMNPPSSKTSGQLSFLDNLDDKKIMPKENLPTEINGALQT